MNEATDKGDSLVALFQALEERFGPDAFPLEGEPSGDPHSVCLTSAMDNRVTFSVVTADMRPGRYSIIVEVPRPEGEECIIPFDFAVDNPDASLEEVLSIFEKHRTLGGRTSSQST